MPRELRDCNAVVNASRHHDAESLSVGSPQITQLVLLAYAAYDFARRPIGQPFAKWLDMPIISALKCEDSPIVLTHQRQQKSVVYEPIFQSKQVETAPRVLFEPFAHARLERISPNIANCREQMFLALDDLTVKTPVKNLPAHAVFPMVIQGIARANALEHRRWNKSVTLYDQVKMRCHNTEADQGKFAYVMSELHAFQEEVAILGIAEYGRFPRTPVREMIITVWRLFP